MRLYKIRGYFLVWARNEKDQLFQLKDDFFWDDINKPFYPPYSKDPMEFLGFDEIHSKAEIKFQGKTHDIYLGDNYLNNVCSTNIYPPSKKEINYYLKIEETIIDPGKLENAVFSIEEIGKFAGPYCPNDFHEKSILEIIEGKPMVLPGSQMTLEVFDIAEDYAKFRLGYRVDISKMYTVRKNKPVIYQDTGSSGVNEDYNGWDIKIEIALQQK